jgi:NADH-quinone oxidoreductase subunit F
VPEFEPVITARWGMDGADGIRGYMDSGGYEGLRKAVSMSPQDVIGEVKASGLRGRGGAGFPTGAKWSFIPKDPGKPVYVVANADEGEPGTFKDRELMERDPHQLIEGIAITSYAVGCHTAFLYMRGEFLEAARQVERAIVEARSENFLGKGIAGSDFDLDIVMHRGAGAYICGEETALLESLEGRRGQPRLRPPFPAVEGLYGSPTVINNVETLCVVPHILQRGADWHAKIGPQSSAGTKIFCVSGKVARPGNYEAPMGTPARVIIDELAGASETADRSRRGRLADPRPHFSPPSIWIPRWTSNPSRHRVPCSARGPSSSSTRRTAWWTPSSDSPSSTPTSRAGSARPAGRGRGGW